MNVRHLLLQTVHIARHDAGTSAWGEAQYSAPAAVPCRVEWAEGVGPAGEGETTATRASIITEAPIGPKDRVWLPGTTPGTVAQARTPGPDGCEPAISLAGTTDYYVTKV